MARWSCQIVWKSRKPGLVGWGLGHAVVAQNRRAVYADGHAQMYGRTDQPDFRRIEGYEDHGGSELSDEICITHNRSTDCVRKEKKRESALAAMCTSSAPQIDTRP